MNDSLVPFFYPRGVVIYGVSSSPEKLGYGVARNLVDSHYQGSIHFLGQKSGELFVRPVYTHLSQVPDPVDLAVLVIPASATPEALLACSSRGIRAVTIISAGFREAGQEGAQLEDHCLQIARTHGIRLLGPNCIGTIDTNFPLDTSFLRPPIAPRGGIAFLSHSGAFCAAIVDWSRNQAFGFSQIVSLGNQADINETDMLPMISEDKHTRVIALYMEGVSEGARFVRIAAEVTRQKPIVALKVGRLESGQKAAASHTGALAASDVAFDAAFRKAGIFRASSSEELFDWARALEYCPLPQGRRVAVLTDAGGPGVIAADALEDHGLHLAQLAASTLRLLSDHLPPAASVHNPVDMLASASPGDYALCLRILLADPDVDSLLVILPPPPMFAPETVATALIPAIQESQKPVVVTLLGSESVAVAFDLFKQAHIPTYPFPERAASALSILSRRADFLTKMRAQQTPLLRPFTVHPRSGMSVEDLLATYDIPAIPMQLAKSAAEAVAISADIGFPVVMKIAAAGISHKSDLGGVLLDIKDTSEVHNGYTKLMQAFNIQLPTAKIEGVYLQRQASPGQELILGAVRDPHFGPLIMFGSGGVEAEGLRDVAFDLAPLSYTEADEMMDRTWAGRKLDGFRNIPPADRSAVRDALIRLSWLAFEHPEISEIEINPLRVFKHGILALDIRSKS